MMPKYKSLRFISQMSEILAGQIVVFCRLLPTPAIHKYISMLN